MGKHFRKILIIVTALLFALPILLIAVSCKSVEPRDEADVIPDKLGTSEGLWLYKGNTRTRTDGTGEESLLTSITVDETEYGEEDFEIVYYTYIRKSSEIFYIIQIGDDCRLCHYNYKTKESSDLYDLPDTQTPQSDLVEMSDSLVYVADRAIFSYNAELMYDDYHGTLDGNIVYNLKGKEFEYVMNGEKHVIKLGSSFAKNAYQRYGNYVYLLGSEVYAINLDTEECTTLSVFNTGDDIYLGYKDYYYMDGSLYVLTRSYSRNYNTDERYFQFIRITGASASVVYDFGAASSMYMSIDGSTIYLEKDEKGDREYQYAAYDSKTGELKRASSKEFENGKTTSDLKKPEKISGHIRSLTVGEYTFYVDSIGYDKEIDGFMGGLLLYQNLLLSHAQTRRYGRNHAVQSE
ncbi:MAG: hypothetical protein K2L02_01875 [Clostridia bacterium]|nr:hypothetical protein [Clostridia bacterium]